MKSILNFFANQKNVFLFVSALLFASCNQDSSKTQVPNQENIDPMNIRNNYIPTTISPEAQKNLTAVYDAKPYGRQFPEADDMKGWHKTHNDVEVAKREVNEKVVAKFQAKIVDDEIAGVPVVHIYPKDWKENRKVFIYCHGGAYTLFSAHSTLTSAVPMADVTGLHVVSIDYTNPPFARWDEIQEQVVTVITELLKRGYTMTDIAIFGDSAGGGLTISTVHNLRDQGLGVPAAVVLLSPWADLSNNGDTYHTLENTDPTLGNELLLSSAKAYANDLNLTDARVSPIYGDFSKGFSPTLITEGTKCIFLSNSVRIYQAIEAAGIEAKLDVYEGMWHVFQQSPMPETEVSYKKISTFVNRHLGL